MEREEKVRERGEEKEELLGAKLKHGIVVGKRGGNTTPSPTWRFGLVGSDGALLGDPNFASNTTLSARKLCANLWEIHPLNHPHLKVVKMNEVDEPPHSSSVQEAPFTELSKQHHHLSGRNGDNLQASSVASYGSSTEMASYNAAMTPSSSSEMKGRTGERSYCLKTSTELLNVLNRIWRLEEQHRLNMSVVKALKKDLDHSRRRIKELLQEKQSDRLEIDQLKKKMAQIKVTGKVMESDQIKIHSVRKELEDERKLRRHSESIHRKLARQVSEINSSFCNALKEIEKERSARVLLEQLCDEFAKGIKDYEEELRLLRKNKTIDPIAQEHNDKLILHLSEAWMDGRMQLKQEEPSANLVEKNSVAEKLLFEIETFLRSKPTAISRNNNTGHSEDPSRTKREQVHSERADARVANPAKGHIPLYMKELRRGSLQETRDKEMHKLIHLQGNIPRAMSLPVAAKQIQHENIIHEETFDPSQFTGPDSPVKKWTSFTIPNPAIFEASLEQPQGMKDNSLRAKLLEARLESRSRTCKVFSRADQAKG